MDTCTYVSAGDDLLNYGERERERQIHTHDCTFLNEPFASDRNNPSHQSPPATSTGTK